MLTIEDYRAGLCSKDEILEIIGWQIHHCEMSLMGAGTPTEILRTNQQLSVLKQQQRVILLGGRA
ncbi:hypothetical protein [Microbulbifer discodermiae]|uniref:hypothetical protein n=1 Tax=Microbulbifer sp. 2201CG32-9 TaxID=3232309 RepID=UPI00345BACF8